MMSGCASAAFIAETPIDEPLDDLANVNALKSLVEGSVFRGKKAKALPRYAKHGAREAKDR